MADVKIVRLLGVADDLICQIQKCGGKYRLVDILCIRAIPIEVPEENKSELAIDAPVAPKKPPKIEFQIGMAPFHMPYMDAEKPLDCDKCQVVYTIDPVPEVLRRYNSFFSRIIQPQLTVTESKVRL